MRGRAAPPISPVMNFTLFGTRRRPERGAALVEYSMLLVLIALICWAAVAAVGRETSDEFEAVATTLAEPSGRGTESAGGDRAGSGADADEADEGSEDEGDDASGSGNGNGNGSGNDNGNGNGNGNGAGNGNGNGAGNGNGNGAGNGNGNGAGNGNGNGNG